jgi:hypothetical protein
MSFHLETDGTFDVNFVYYAGLQLYGVVTSNVRIGRVHPAVGLCDLFIRQLPALE